MSFFSFFRKPSNKKSPCISYENHGDELKALGLIGLFSEDKFQVGIALMKIQLVDLESLPVYSIIIRRIAQLYFARELIKWDFTARLNEDEAELARFCFVPVEQVSDGQFKLIKKKKRVYGEQAMPMDRTIRSYDSLIARIFRDALFNGDEALLLECLLDESRDSFFWNRIVWDDPNRIALVYVEHVLDRDGTEEYLSLDLLPKIAKDADLDLLIEIMLNTEPFPTGAIRYMLHHFLDDLKAAILKNQDIECMHSLINDISLTITPVNVISTLDFFDQIPRIHQMPIVLCYKAIAGRELKDLELELLNHWLENTTVGEDIIKNLCIVGIKVSSSSNFPLSKAFTLWSDMRTIEDIHSYHPLQYYLDIEDIMRSKSVKNIFTYLSLHSVNHLEVYAALFYLLSKGTVRNDASLTDAWWDSLFYIFSNFNISNHTYGVFNGRNPWTALKIAKSKHQTTYSYSSYPTQCLSARLLPKNTKEKLWEMLELLLIPANMFCYAVGLCYEPGQIFQQDYNTLSDTQKIILHKTLWYDYHKHPYEPHRVQNSYFEETRQLLKSLDFEVPEKFLPSSYGIYISEASDESYQFFLDGTALYQSKTEEIYQDCKIKEGEKILSMEVDGKYEQRQYFERTNYMTCFGKDISLQLGTGLLIGKEIFHFRYQAKTNENPKDVH